LRIAKFSRQSGGWAKTSYFFGSLIWCLSPTKKSRESKKAPEGVKEGDAEALDLPEAGNGKEPGDDTVADRGAGAIAAKDRREGENAVLEPHPLHGIPGGILLTIDNLNESLCKLLEEVPVVEAPALRHLREREEGMRGPLDGLLERTRDCRVLHEAKRLCRELHELRVRRVPD